MPPVKCTSSKKGNNGVENEAKAEGGGRDENGDENGFKTKDRSNELVQLRKDSRSRYNVLLFGDAGFHCYLKSILAKIQGNKRQIDHLERCLKSSEEKDGQGTNGICEHKPTALEKENKKAELLRTLQRDVAARWSTSENRIIGHVILSPPIMANGYYEDWAAIEIDQSMANSSNFMGNAIHFSRRAWSYDLAKAQYRTVEYPASKLLEVQGIIPDEEMSSPPKLEKKKN